MFSWEGRQRTYGGPRGLCEWESSLWTLRPVPLLSLVKRGLNGSAPHPRGLPVGHPEVWAGEGLGHRPQERNHCQHGPTQGSRHVAREEQRGRWEGSLTLQRLMVAFLGQQAPGVVGAKCWMQALSAFLTQMSCSPGCLTQIGRLSPFLVTPVPWLGWG